MPYDSSDVENINLQNGNVNLKIPLASLPPMAGGKAGFTVYAYYNSKLWDSYIEERHTPPGNMVWYGVSIPRQSPFGGWRIGSAYSIESESALDDYDFDAGNPTSDPTTLQGYHRTFLTTPDGGRHEMRPYGPTPYSGNMSMFFGYVNQSPQTTGQPMIYYSTDGSYIRMKLYPVSSSTTLYAEIFLPDGSKVEMTNTGQKITDANGNSVKIFGDSEGQHYQDEHTEREILVKLNEENNFEVKYQSVGGEWQTIEIVFDTVAVQGHFYTVTIPDTCSFEEPFSETFSVVREIIFPQTESAPPKYTFEYNADETIGDPAYYTPACNNSPTTYSNPSNGFGELSSMTTPTGAIHEYEYLFDGNHIVNNGNPSWDIGANKILEKSVTHDGTTDTWTYDISETGTTVYNPDGSTNVSESYSHSASGPAAGGGSSGLGGLTYRETNAGNVRVEKRWTNLTFTGASQVTSGGYLAFNPVVTQEYTSFLNSSGNPVLMSAKTFQHDFNGNVIETKEYDWFDPSLVSRDSNNLPTGVPSSATLLRTTSNEYHNSPLSNSSTDVYAKTTNTILIAAKQVTIGNSQTLFFYDGATAYTTAPTHGNITKKSVWDSVTSDYIDTTAGYDSRGNVTSQTDANGYVTQYTYGSIDGVSGLYPTQTVTAYGTSIARTVSNTYDFSTGLVTSTTDEDNDLTNAFDYDIFGRQKKAIAAEGTALEQWTVTEFHDNDRFVVVKSDVAMVGDGKRLAINHYDQLGRVRLSRRLENAAIEDPEDEQDGVKIETRYKTTGTCTFDSSKTCTFQITSNPYRAATASAATNEETMGWTLTQARIDGRFNEQQTFQGAGLPSSFGGSNSNSTGIIKTTVEANATTVEDQAGKLRRSLTNAAGQVVRVDEPTSSGLGSVSSPNQPTGYTYDVLNNLLTVTQTSSTTTQCGGASSCSQTRTFTYSTLSRLLTSDNPESGTISFTYDANGNLKTKRDARNIKTVFDYDGLGRLKKRCYRSIGTGTLGMTTCTDNNETTESNTPDVTFTYDGATHAKGKLTKVESTVSSTEYVTFDELGRITRSKQTTDGVVYGTDTNPMTYTYSLSGLLIEQKYPSGRVVKNSFDRNGTLSQVQSERSGGTFQNYANSFSYNAAGAVVRMRLGNGRWESTKFNSRLQPIEMALGLGANAQDILKLNYGYGTSGNNGNVQSQTITVPGLSYAFAQTYSYDVLNRLSAAEETYNSTTTWKQSFSYDRFGNRSFVESDTAFNGFNKLCSSDTALCSDLKKKYNPSIDLSSNKLNTSDGYVYDSNGNVTEDAAERTFVYDGENKQVLVTDGSGTVGQYWYDGDGKRVKKYVPASESSPEETTVFVYDAAGKQIVEYSTIVQETEAANVNYLTNDRLGSPRIITDAVGNIVNRHDYHPFGEQTVTSQRDPGHGYKDDTVRKKFTGYERDDETGLDFAEARMYSITLGRFTTSDPLMASAIVITPQSWNRYSYVLNNPLNVVDPSGELPTDFTEEQRRVFQTFVEHYNRDNHSKLSADEVWNTLNESQQSTFRAITHALENTPLKKDGKPMLGADGKPLNALKLVESVSQVSGILMTKDKGGKEVQDKEGSKQFRLLVTLKEGAIDTLNKYGGFHDSTHSHVYINGQLVKDGTATIRDSILSKGMQISFLTSDRRTADIDIDYNPFTSGKHGEPCNSDIQCGDNLKTHNKLFGKKNPLSNVPRKREYTNN